jgi:hypothetical protein
MTTHKKFGEPRFTFYDPQQKMFWSTKTNQAVKSFENASVWKDVTNKPVHHWILEVDDDGKSWSDSIRDRYNIPASFKKIIVSVEYKITNL